MPKVIISELQEQKRLDNLERLDERFPNKEMLMIKDVQEYTGLCYETVKKLFKFNKCKMISKVTLARELAQ